jgi:hypothetical protein
VVFFKILLVGYLNNNNRDRKQLEFCNDSSAIRSFLNLEIDEALPSHSNFYSKKQSSKTSKLKRLLMRSFFHTTMNFFLENGVVQRLRVLAAGVLVHLPFKPSAVLSLCVIVCLLFLSVCVGLCVAFFVFFKGSGNFLKTNAKHSRAPLENQLYKRVILSCVGNAKLFVHFIIILSSRLRIPLRSI